MAGMFGKEKHPSSPYPISQPTSINARSPTLF